MKEEIKSFYQTGEIFVSQYPNTKITIFQDAIDKHFFIEYKQAKRIGKGKYS